MKTCQTCNNEVGVGVNFCVKCGSDKFNIEEELPLNDDLPFVVDEALPEDDVPLHEGSDASQDDELPEHDEYRASFEYHTEPEETASPAFIDVESKKENPNTGGKWPMWAKALIFMMSMSIITAVTLLVLVVLDPFEPRNVVVDEAVTATVAIPENLVGATSQSAKSVLEARGFLVAEVRSHHETVTSGNVITLYPPSGNLEFGEVIILYVSLGREPVPLPDTDVEEIPEPPIDYDDEETEVVTRFAIRFNANGGLGVMPSMFAGEGQNFIVPANQFTRGDYVFTYWSEMPDGGGMSIYPGMVLASVWRDIDLFAQWRAPDVLVSYHANGGLGEMADVTVTLGQNHTVLFPGFTRSGFDFVGWNTQSDGSGRMYLPNQTIVSLLGNVDLYAQWQAVRIAVTNIINVPTSGRTNVPLSLTGTAMPHNSTVRSPINWSVISGSGVSISANVLTVSQPGGVTVRATIPNGLDVGVDFTQYFTIIITQAEPDPEN